MLFGHNTNVSLEGITYHVQTEDRGTNHALIDTTVHCRGRVMYRRTNTYSDLLPLDARREEVLRQRLDEQHRAVIDEMRSGKLQLPPPPPEPPKRHASPEEHASLAAPATGGKPTTLAPAAEYLKLELLNAKTWLTGKNACLQIVVRDASSHIVSGASVSVRVDGASGPVEFLANSDARGRANLEFEMPKLAAGDAALSIRGSYGSAQGQLRFSLRAKPRVPAAG